MPKDDRVTYFVIQTYIDGPDGLVVEEPIGPLDSLGLAQRRYERLMPEKAGIVLFSRTGDPDLGDWEDAKIIAQGGRVAYANNDDLIPF